MERYKNAVRKDKAAELYLLNLSLS
ncbi:abi-like family protein, partial [Neisseria gonorrhoeae]